MKYPDLVKKSVCKCYAEITAEQEGLNVYGEPLEAVTWQGYGNLQDGAKTILTADKKLITVSGKYLISGDAFPNLPNITKGTITVNGMDRQIYEGRKARNPDNTVNYTEIIIQ